MKQILTIAIIALAFSVSAQKKKEIIKIQAKQIDSLLQVLVNLDNKLANTYDKNTSLDEKHKKVNNEYDALFTEAERLKNQADSLKLIIKEKSDTIAQIIEKLEQAGKKDWQEEYKEWEWDKPKSFQEYMREKKLNEDIAIGDQYLAKCDLNKTYTIEGVFAPMNCLNCFQTDKYGLVRFDRIDDENFSGEYIFGGGIEQNKNAGKRYRVTFIKKNLADEGIHEFITFITGVVLIQ